MTTLHAPTVTQLTLDRTSCGGKQWRGDLRASQNIIPFPRTWRQSSKLQRGKLISRCMVRRCQTTTPLPHVGRKTRALNATLRSLQPDDTLIIPNKTYHLIGSIRADDVSGVTIWYRESRVGTATPILKGKLAERQGWGAPMSEIVAVTRHASHAGDEGFETVEDEASGGAEPWRPRLKDRSSDRCS